MELQKERTESQLVTREKKTNIGALDAARLKVRAVRRSTMKRQGSGIDLHKIMKDMENQGLIAKEKVDELDDEMSSSSDNTVVNGEIQKKAIRTSNHSKRQKDEYLLSPQEKLTLQKETQEHIRNIIKASKIQAKNTQNYYLAKYGKPEQLVVRNKNKSLYESTKLIQSLSRSQNKPLLNKQSKASNNTDLKSDYFLHTRQGSDIHQIAPMYKTTAHFYRHPTPQSHVSLTSNLPPAQSAYNMTTKNWKKPSVNPTTNASTHMRAQTVCTHLTGIRPTYLR